MNKKMKIFTILLGMVIFFLVIGSVGVYAFNWENTISYYRLDGTSGNVIDDLLANPGENVGATRGITGIIDDAFDFDGSGDYINLTDSADWDTIRAVSLWIKAETQVANDWILSNSADGQAGGIRLRFQSASTTIATEWLTDGDTGIISYSGYGDQTGSWSSIILNWNTGTNNLEMWIDGVNVQNDTSISGVFNSPNEMLLGEFSSFQGNTFDGIMDEVAFLIQL